MKKINFFLIIALLPLAVHAKLSLPEAIRKAIEMDPDVQNTILETFQSRLEEQNARFQKWFSARLGGDYRYQSEQMEINLPDIPLGNDVTIRLDPMTVGVKHNYDLKLAINQPLFTGGMLTNTISLNQARVELLRNQTRACQIDVVRLVKSSYFQHKLLKSKLASLDTFIKKLKLHRQKLSDFYREDLIKKSDLLETECRLQEQMLSREEVEDQIESERIHFESLCGVGIDDVLEDYSEPINRYLDSLSDFRSAHPLLNVINHQKEMIAFQKKMVKGSSLPQIGGFLELHYARPGIDFFRDDWMLYFQGGIHLDFNLFDWNTRKRQQKILGHELEKLTNQRQDFIRQVEKKLKQLYESKTSAERRSEIIESLIENSEEDIRLKEELLEEQQISNIDYLAALATRERYESMGHAVKIQIELIKTNINALIGKTEKTLQEAP